ncbi:ChaC-like protein-domain-containing protein [Bipolaris maydis]|nr:ChaC-like protein-domain-containing protein [Bipolaris maydis]
MTTEHDKEIESFGANNDFWIFGYGSLIWKPPPHYDQRLPGYIEGYVRRFWQDHRGTPEAPGRVVTLIDRAHWETLGDQHDAPSRVWGAAYHIPARHVESVRKYLDLREINGYSIQFTPFHPAVTSTASVVPEPECIKCLVYIGLPENPQFLGAQDPDELATKILQSKGPSGENREYLYNLDVALLGLSEDSGDAHVSDLVERCRALEEEMGTGGGNEGEKSGEVLHKVGSTEEQEEVEK